MADEQRDSSPDEIPARSDVSQLEDPFGSPALTAAGMTAGAIAQMIRATAAATPTPMLVPEPGPAMPHISGPRLLIPLPECNGTVTAYTFRMNGVAVRESIATLLLKAHPELRDPASAFRVLPSDLPDATIYIYAGYCHDGVTACLIKSYHANSQFLKVTKLHIQDACEELVKLGYADAIRGLQGIRGSKEFSFWFKQLIGYLRKDRQIAYIMGVPYGNPASEAVINSLIE